MSNTATQQLDAANALTELWKGLLPDYTLPAKAQFLTWSAMGSEELAAYALNRAARKARRAQTAGNPMDDERLGRYVSGIIRNEREGRHTFATEERVMA